MIGESIFNKNVEKHLDKLFGSLLLRRNPEPEPRRLTPYITWPIVYVVTSPIFRCSAQRGLLRLEGEPAKPLGRSVFPARASNCRQSTRSSDPQLLEGSLALERIEVRKHPLT